MRSAIKIILPTMLLCALLSACSQPPEAETPLPTPGPALTGSPALSPEEGEMRSVQTGLFGERGWEDSRRLEPGELEELFVEWGFSEEEPFYRYRTPEGELDLTLYLDEREERGIGFWGDLEDDMGRRDGFAFEGFSSPEGWGDWYGWRDPYALPEVERNDVILDCWEEWEYNNWVRKAEGCVYAKVDDPRFDDPDRVPLYEAKYTYNEETRKLEHREIWTNFSPCLGLGYEPHDSWYDEQGRLAYEEKYITHGSQNYYYIYREGSMAPAYCLYVDLADSPVNDLALIRYPEPFVPEPLPEGSLLTLAGEELDYAVLRRSYDDTPADFAFDETAQLEERFRACGFAAEEPFYEFYDQEGRRELALWYDELTGAGIGLWCKYYYSDGPVVYGLGFEETLAAEDWEQAEYIRWEPEHDVYESCYDDLGRLTYEKGYITHGSLRYYYIYEGENVAPEYVLFLDDGTGVTPELVRF